MENRDEKDHRRISARRVGPEPLSAARVTWRVCYSNTKKMFERQKKNHGNRPPQQQKKPLAGALHALQKKRSSRDAVGGCFDSLRDVTIWGLETARCGGVRLNRLGFGFEGREDLLELLGRVDESVPLFELGVNELAVHRHLEGAGVRGGGRTRALSLGIFGLDSILHLLVLGGVACAEERE